jgi:hypothetical protein
MNPDRQHGAGGLLVCLGAVSSHVQAEDPDLSASWDTNFSSDVFLSFLHLTESE